MYKIKKLKDCATIIAGQSPESKYYNTEGIGIPFFQGKADFGELYPTVRVYCSQPTKIAEKDDILLSVRAPVGPTNLSPGRVCIGRGLAAIRPFSDMSLRYLLYYFRFFESQLSAKGTGTTFKAITQATIKNLDVPVPPLPDQEHIVFRIEELFSQLDASVAELKTAKEQLDTCPPERTDLLAEYQLRHDVIQEYAPALMSQDEVQAYITEKFAEIVATKNKGQVMKAVMAELKGKADGKVINQVVAELCK